MEPINKPEVPAEIPGQANFRIVVIGLTLLLLVSLFINGFLVLGNPNAKKIAETNPANAPSAQIEMPEPKNKVWFLPKSEKKGYALSLYEGKKDPSLFVYSADEKKLKPTGIKSNVYGGAAGLGSTEPQNSPDLLYTAYIEDEDLWIMSNQTLEAVRATENGRVGFLSGWSKDSKVIVYTVSDGNNMDMMIGGLSRPDGIKKLPKNDPPGFYSLNIYTGESKYLFQLKNFLTFVDDNRILTTDNVSSNEDNSGTLEVFNIDTFEMDYTIKDNFGFGSLQYNFTSDGKKWSHTFSRNPTDDMGIVYADFPNKEGVTIDSGSWAEVQWPKFSPDNKKIAYVKRMSTVDGVPQNKVAVYDTASKNIKTYADGSFIDWLTPSLILFRENKWTSDKDSKYFVLDLKNSSVSPVN